jgi:hypothetical protein
MVPNSPVLMVLALGLGACSQTPRTSGPTNNTNQTGGDSGAQNSPADTGAQAQADTGAQAPTDSGDQTQADSGMTMMTADTGENTLPDTGQNPPRTDGGFAMDAMAMNSLCPPSGPFGAFVGNTAPDVRLKDCDGNAFSLHDICTNKATWMFAMPGW